MNVIKENGDKEQFSPRKVLLSIKRAGIPQTIQTEVLKHVKSKIYEGVKTSEIYHHIAEFLERSDLPYAKTKYGLKHAIMDLGPTGYPFEDFIAEILKTKGYQTTIRSILKGACITHEIDVIAQKGGKRIMVEAKFHNLPGTKTHSHVPMYTKARFDDVKTNNQLDEAWLVTNTNTSSDALSYALCVGLKVISWSYPDGESLRDLIEKSKLVPVTALTTLSHLQKQQLMQHNVTLCKDICRDQSFLTILNLPEEKKREVIAEASFVCNS